MSDYAHGFSVSVDHTGDERVLLTLHAKGKLRHEDYQVMVPMLETAISGMKSPKIDVMMDAREMDGWEMHAAWDDFKLGLKHGHQFNKVAMVGSKSWQETAAKIGSWFIGGEARFFEDKTEALAWLMKDS